MSDLHFYFYQGCPWTYLAFGRVRETATRTGARIVWKPILMEEVTAHLPPGQPVTGEQPIVVPAKARYQVKDLADWCAFCGVAIRHPGPFPLAAEWAARGVVVAAEAGRMPAYSEAMFAAGFRDLQDISALDVVARIAASVGLEAGDFIGAVQDASTRRMVEDNSRELVARGGFGSPTMFIGDDMYFGNDRMPLVEFALSRATERPLVAPGAHGQQRT